MTGELMMINCFAKYRMLRHFIQCLHLNIYQIHVVYFISLVGSGGTVSMLDTLS